LGDTFSRDRGGICKRANSFLECRALTWGVVNYGRGSFEIVGVQRERKKNPRREREGNLFEKKRASNIFLKKTVKAAFSLGGRSLVKIT